MKVFKTPDSISLNVAVLEIVRLAQISLTFFDCLKSEYTDGLLCDRTVEALAVFNQTFGPFESEVSVMLHHNSIFYLMPSY